MVREAIAKLVEGRSLTMEEAAAAMGEIMSGGATPAQIGAFLTALRINGETVDEIAGMARVMREKSLHVQVDGLVVDTCGTGGDGSGTFNISTAAAFVVAGAGLRVAKHGNRAASGQCGSADVLEAFGVKIDLGPEGVKRCIEEVGIGFMFAPAFHPSMRHAAPVRREIGIRTVFNFLGPLTNPAGVQVQVIGVPNAAMAEKLAQALLRLGTTRRALVVHGQDGLDEITLTGPTLVWELNRGSLAQYPIDPVTLGLRTTRLQALKGGDVATNKSIMAAVLQGQKGPARDVVLLNAAAALMAAEAARDLKNGLALAATAIDSGEAYGKLQALATLSQTLK